MIGLDVGAHGFPTEKAFHLANKRSSPETRPILANLSDQSYTNDEQAYTAKLGVWFLWCNSSHMFAWKAPSHDTLRAANW